MEGPPKIMRSFPETEKKSSRSCADAFNLVRECSKEHTPRSFCIKLLELLKTLCPYDMAAILFFDANNKISGMHTAGRKRRELKKYLVEYTQDFTEKLPEFNLFANMKETSGFLFSGVIDWQNLSDDEFKKQHIAPLNLRYSMSFCFFDLSGTYRVVFALDRVRDVPFSEEEQNCLGLALPVLNNIHRNFFYSGIDDAKGSLQTPWKQYHLTPREEEIMALLCQGMTTQNISSALYISVGTTYKHVANILKKAGVTSKQELIVRIMGRQEF